MYQILICPTVNVHYTVFCGHQRAAIMPGIETAFECMILFSFTFTFEIYDHKYWSGSTYHTFYKIGCLSVQNIPPRQVLVPPQLKNPICVPGCQCCSHNVPGYVCNPGSPREQDCCVETLWGTPSAMSSSESYV